MLQRDGSFVTYQMRTNADSCGFPHFFDEMFGGIIGIA